MKKKLLTSLSMAAALSLQAGTIPVVSGWTLAGAPSDISINDISANSNCVKAIWQYDGSLQQPWLLHHRDVSSHSYGSINNLAQGSGFWVLGDESSNCDINYESTDTTSPIVAGAYYNSYGFRWLDRKDSDSYLVPNNAVDFVSSEYKFLFSSFHDSSIDSQTEIKTDVGEAYQVVGKVKLTSGSGDSSSHIAVRAGRSVMTTSTAFRTDNGLITTGNVYSVSRIQVRGDQIKARVHFEDSEGNKVEVFNETLLNISTVGAAGIGTIKLNKDDQTILFVLKDSTGTTLLGSKLFTIDTNHYSFDKFDSVRVRTQINADSSNSNVTAELYYVDAEPFLFTKATTLTIADLEAAGTYYNVDRGDDWYDRWDLSTGTFSATEYDYNGTNWESDGRFSVNYTIDTTNASVAHISSPITGDNFAADLEIIRTKQLDDNTDLYISDVKYTVTSQGNLEVDTWDGSLNPMHGGNPVTNRDELIDLFTDVNEYWHLGEYMLSPDGVVVYAVANGTWDDGNTKYIRGSVVSGASWSIDSNVPNEFMIETPEEEKWLGIIGDATNGYYIQEQSADRVGSVWYEQIITGTGAEAKARELALFPYK